jgi:phospholipid/cholesterol/gamma-HCH transport system substrate-binding protein
MEREANYAAVGAFVLIVSLLGALFVYWYSDSREHRSYNRYEVYFTGSVSGLDRGAAVRYLGVGVGRVVEMRLDPRSTNRVQVVVDIDATTPITDNTVAELQLQGAVTGLLYIDLREDHTAQLPPAVPSMTYPVIRSAPSRFDVLLASLPKLVGAADELIERANRFLSDENLAGVNHAVANIDKASSNLPQTLHEVNALVSELRSASADLSATAHTARATLATVGPDVQHAAQKLQVIADNLGDASSQLNQAIAENRQDVRSFARDGLPEIERFVREGRAAAADIRALADSLRENPGQLLYQQEQLGVEIPR